MQPPEQSELDNLLGRYRELARMPADESPVYVELCRRLAEDPERAGLALLARPAFRTPLILLAAVHHLLLSGIDDALAAYYPSVAGEAARPPDSGLYPAFAAFLDAHRPAVVRLVATRSTQTNEVRRTAATLPALGLVQRAGGGPLAVLEVGASAGLNLLPDRYAYRIGAVDAGDRGSPVRLACEPRGELVPPVPDRVQIGWRLGLDLDPLDLGDPRTREWLRALVWPEHLDRLAALDAAIGVARPDPPLVARGDLVDDLPGVAGAAPAGPLVVLSTWVLTYVPEQRRPAFIAALQRLCRERGAPTWLVSCESERVVGSLGIGVGDEAAELGGGESLLTLHRFEPDGSAEHRLLGICHPHGRWLRWLDPRTGSPA